MTTAKATIHAALVADSAYLALLGSPAAAPYRTYYGEPPRTPVFPMVVFAFGSRVTDGEVSRDLLSRQTSVRFTAWTEDETYEDIILRIIQIWHQKAGADGIWLSLEDEGEERFDEEVGARGLMATFTMLTARGILS